MSEELLLISDLDHALLGDQEAIRHFSEFFPTVRDRLAIVYASRRFFEDMKVDIQTVPLPEPRAVITSAGSEIRSYPDGAINRDWGECFSDRWSARRVREILDSEPDLELQPEQAQSDFKVSYFFPDASPQDCDRLRNKLLESGIPVCLIYSSNRHLDLLPEGVHKGTAAAFVAQQMGFDRDHVVVAGNAGHDPQLFEHDFYGISVSNADQDKTRYGEHDRIYRSKRVRADGVRDGLRHWIGHLTDAS